MLYSLNYYKTVTEKSRTYYVNAKIYLSHFC